MIGLGDCIKVKVEEDKEVRVGVQLNLAISAGLS